MNNQQELIVIFETGILVDIQDVEKTICQELWNNWYFITLIAYKTGYYDDILDHFRFWHIFQVKKILLAI